MENQEHPVTPNYLINQKQDKFPNCSKGLTRNEKKEKKKSFLQPITLSISPKTISCVPIIATKSANKMTFNHEIPRPKR